MVRFEQLTLFLLLGFLWHRLLLLCCSQHTLVYLKVNRFVREKMIIESLRVQDLVHVDVLPFDCISYTVSEMAKVKLGFRIMLKCAIVIRDHGCKKAAILSKSLFCRFFESFNSKPACKE